MTDLRKLSEAATPGEWVSPYNESDGLILVEVMRGERIIGKLIRVEDAKLSVALVNAYRSGSLIPRPEYERVLALLAEAREALAQYQRDLCEGFCRDLPTREYFEEDMAIDCAACRSRATLSRIDDALAAQPEAKS